MSDQIFLELLDDKCMPSRATVGAAGWDAHARLEQTLVVEPGHRCIVPLGIKLELPFDMECQVRSRSGLAAKQGVFILNAPGTIDSDYRGELCAIIYNSGDAAFNIDPHDRVCQLVFQHVPAVQLVPLEKLSKTERDSGRFGSTGIK